MEALVVIVIVAAATLYAAWSLSPGTIRARGSAAVLRLLESSSIPLPSALRAWLFRVLTAQVTRASGCGHCAPGKRPRAAVGGETRRAR
jgi:hypothetical protein